jgi:hypothetical protein
MRGAIAVLAVAALLAPAGLGAEKKDKPKQAKGGTHADAGASGSVTFTTGQRDGAHGWYAETYGRGKCPPGLAKKNNGCLPPGQAKKRYAVGQPLPSGIKWSTPPPELIVRVGHPPQGYLYVTLDGDLLKLAVGTLLVVDAISGLVD